MRQIVNIIDEDKSIEIKLKVPAEFIFLNQPKNNVKIGYIEIYSIIQIKSFKRTSYKSNKDYYMHALQDCVHILQTT